MSDEELMGLFRDDPELAAADLVTEAKVSLSLLKLMRTATQQIQNNTIEYSRQVKNLEDIVSHEISKLGSVSEKIHKDAIDIRGYYEGIKEEHRAHATSIEKWSRDVENRIEKIEREAKAQEEKIERKAKAQDTQLGNMESLMQNFIDNSSLNFENFANRVDDKLSAFSENYVSQKQLEQEKVLIDKNEELRDANSRAKEIREQGKALESNDEVGKLAISFARQFLTNLTWKEWGILFFAGVLLAVAFGWIEPELVEWFFGLIQSLIPG